MPYTNGHGGDCCGITHIISFSYPGVQEERDVLNRIGEVIDGLKDGNGLIHDDGSYFRRPFGHMFEVVLATPQVIGEPGQERVNMLKKHGFRLVNRFLNDNSGNECFVFHYTIKRRPLSGKTLPFTF